MAFMTLAPVLATLFGLVPAIVLPTESFSEYLKMAFDILEIVLFVLPSGTVITIFSIIMSIQLLRIVIAFIKMIWSLLPVV